MLGRHIRSLRSKRKTLKMNKSATAPNAYLRYDWSRVFAVAAFIALVAITTLMIVLASCTPSQRSTMTGAFAACADADLGKIVTSDGKTLLGDVSGIIKGNAPTLEADLSGLVITVGIAAVECAIVAVEAMLAAPPDTGSAGSAAGSGSAVAALKALPPAPGLVRAQAWLKAQRGVVK